MKEHLRVLCLYFLWLLADLVVVYQCTPDWRSHLGYMTTWSHIFSLLCHHPILLYLLCLEYVGEPVIKGAWSDTITTACVRLFCASGVILAAILITFFVVVVLDDELFSERVDATTLPHYKHIHQDSYSIPSDSASYFARRDFNEFSGIGLMVTYNNIRHVLPAVLHLLITMDMPLIRFELSRFQTHYIIISALVLPAVHVFHVGWAGEEELYRAEPLLPAVAMVLSIFIASFYYKTLGQTPAPSPYAPPFRHSDQRHQNPFLSL